MSQLKKSLVLASLLMFSGAGLAASPSNPPVGTAQGLSGVDTLLTTVVSKSMISGALAKDPATGLLALDPNGNFMFDYSGDVFHMVTDHRSGELTRLMGPIGSVEGQAAFPPAFAGLAFAVYEWLVNGADPDQMPPIPSRIDWTMNEITVIVDGTTYIPFPDPELGLEARAFTGLGPVEIGEILNGPDGLSMSVRMGGCFAIQAADGPHEGKIGTYCLNGSFTFDLSGIDLSNPMASSLVGTGTSNCSTVLHEPLMP